MIDLSQHQKTFYKIIGAAMRVHNELNYGLLEAVYRESMSYELSLSGVECLEEQELPIFYRNRLLKKRYRIDLLVKDVVCELKSVKELLPEHRAQLCNYLRLTKKSLGLLINFGQARLVAERWVFDEEKNECFIVDANMSRLVS